MVKRRLALPGRFVWMAIRHLKHSESAWGWLEMAVRVLLLLGILGSAGVGLTQEDLRWMLTILTPISLALLFLAEGTHLLYNQDRREEAARRKWFFGIGGLSFHRIFSEENGRPIPTDEMVIAIDLMVTDQLDRPASIAEFVLETGEVGRGHFRHSRAIRRDSISQAGIINGRDELLAPLYFQAHESKIGQVTFHGERLQISDPPPVLYVRDEEGTEIRIKLDGKTLTKIASTVRTEDYPT